MKKQDKEAILNSYSREELPSLMSITSEEVLPFHIEAIERKVRSSLGYDLWREYNFRFEDAKIDAINNIDTLDYKKISLELHHVITLWDICEIVGRKLLDENEEIDVYDIVKEVEILHMLGHVPYVPLLISDHQKYHSNILEFPKDKIKGNIQEFIKKYEKYMTKEQIQKVS